MKTILNVIFMEKKKNQKWFKFLNPIINTFFSVAIVLARDDPMGGGMHRICTPAIVMD
jgi:hypothetical protein